MARLVAWALLATSDGAGVVQHRTQGVGFQCALQESRWASREVSCWGPMNDQGQLGQGDTISRPLLQERVLVGGPIRNISSGAHHTCALLETGQVKCWGSNSRGQLGTGDRSNRGDEPKEMGDWLMPVSLGAVAVEVSAGHEHSCARLVDGRVKCWGANSQGQAFSSRPVPAIGIEPWELGANLMAEPLPQRAAKVAETTGAELAEIAAAAEVKARKEAAQMAEAMSEAIAEARRRTAAEAHMAKVMAQEDAEAKTAVAGLMARVEAAEAKAIAVSAIEAKLREELAAAQAEATSAEGAKTEVANLLKEQTEQFETLRHELCAREEHFTAVEYLALASARRASQAALEAELQVEEAKLSVGQQTVAGEALVRAAENVPEGPESNVACNLWSMAAQARASEGVLATRGPGGQMLLSDSRRAETAEARLRARCLVGSAEAGIEMYLQTQRLDLLVCNAGMNSASAKQERMERRVLPVRHHSGRRGRGQAEPSEQLSEDKVDILYQTNYLSHFLLTLLLLPLLRRARGRVISVSSVVHRSASLEDFDRTRAVREPYASLYGLSKLAQPWPERLVESQPSQDHQDPQLAEKLWEQSLSEIRAAGVELDQELQRAQREQQRLGLLAQELANSAAQHAQHELQLAQRRWAMAEQHRVRARELKEETVAFQKDDLEQPSEPPRQDLPRLATLAPLPVAAAAAVEEESERRQAAAELYAQDCLKRLPEQGNDIFDHKERFLI
eukprot:g3562.t2